MSTLALRFFAALIWLATVSQSWGGAAEDYEAEWRRDNTSSGIKARAEQRDPPCKDLPHIGSIFKIGVSGIQARAEQGDPRYQFQLGGSYLYGLHGISKNHIQAEYWYRKAAEQGLDNAQAALAQLYWLAAVRVEYQMREPNYVMDDEYVGERVPGDFAQALYWFRKAAEQGVRWAQGDLASMYSSGSGVAKDDQQAYFWYLLAAVDGHRDSAKRRDRAEAKLPPQQRAEAQAAARNWKGRPSAWTQCNLGVEPSTSNLESQNRDSPSSTGSGFFVARGRVVTNQHVTEECQRLRVAGRGVGRLLASDTRNDLALIELQGGAADTATIRVGRVKVGESATVVGFPLSGLLSGVNVTTGNVSSLSGIRGDIRMLQITAPVQAGNSGGPLLGANGNVIGRVGSKLNALKVAQATGDVPQNVNFAINANVLSSFLDANGVDYKAASSGSTLSTQEIARRAQAFTVLVECLK